MSQMIFYATFGVPIIIAVTVMMSRFIDIEHPFLTSVVGYLLMNLYAAVRTFWNRRCRKSS